MDVVLYHILEKNTFFYSYCKGCFSQKDLLLDYDKLEFDCQTGNVGRLGVLFRFKQNINMYERQFACLKLCETMKRKVSVSKASHIA